MPRRPEPGRDRPSGRSDWAIVALSAHSVEKTWALESQADATGALSLRKQPARLRGATPIRGRIPVRRLAMDCATSAAAVTASGPRRFPASGATTTAFSTVVHSAIMALKRGWAAALQDARPVPAAASPLEPATPPRDMRSAIDPPVGDSCQVQHISCLLPAREPNTPNGPVPIGRPRPALTQPGPQDGGRVAPSLELRAGLPSSTSLAAGKRDGRRPRAGLRNGVGPSSAALFCAHSTSLVG